MKVSSDTGLAATAELSRPFRLKFNRDPSILRRAGVDPARVRQLPDDFRVRAFLAYLATAPTAPGARTPLLTVHAKRADGSLLQRAIGGDMVFEAPEPPPLRPPPGAPRTYPVFGFVRAQARAFTVIDPEGRRWAAELSPVFSTVHRAGRAVRVKAFLAAVRGPSPSRTRTLEFETTLSDGTVE